VHTHSRSGLRKSKSPAKSSYRYTETERTNYMNSVVSSHLEEAKGRVAADLSTVSDCVYLNKFNHMANSDLVNPTLLSSPTKRSGGADDRTASPERLRERFGGRTKSPGKQAKPDLTSVLMDSETRRYVNEYRNQLEYLRSIVYNLDLKLREQDTWQREVNNLRGEVDNGNQAREELRKTLMETTQELKEEAFKFNKVVLELEGHNGKILADLRSANNTVDDLQTRLHAVEVKNAQLENENNELRVKLNCADIYKTQLAQSRNDYIAAEARHADALKSLGDKIRQLDAALSSIQQERQTLLGDNRKLKEKVNNLASQVEEERINNADLQNELDNLRKKLQVSETACELLKSIQDQRDAIIADLNKVRTANENFQSQIGELESDVIERSRDIESMERRNKDDLNRAQRRIRTLEDDLNNFKNNNIDLKKNNSELKNHITSLEQLLCVKEDVFSQLQDATSRANERTDDCDKLREQIRTNGDITESLNDKIMELEKCLVYLKNVVGEKDDVA
jgi:chromosome segregation ATPase